MYLLVDRAGRDFKCRLSIHKATKKNPVPKNPGTILASHEDIVEITERKLAVREAIKSWRRAHAKHQRVLHALKSLVPGPAFAEYHKQAIDKHVEDEPLRYNFIRIALEKCDGHAVGA